MQLPQRINGCAAKCYESRKDVTTLCDYRRPSFSLAGKNVGGTCPSRTRPCLRHRLCQASAQSFHRRISGIQRSTRVLHRGRSTPSSLESRSLQVCTASLLLIANCYRWCLNPSFQEVKSGSFVEVMRHLSDVHLNDHCTSF
jgi:hypothetical protein